MGGQASEDAPAVVPADEEVSFDFDSDELEALEDAADDESSDEEELDRVKAYTLAHLPPQRFLQLMAVLKQHGLAHFMQQEVSALSRDEVLALIMAQGLLLPRALREDKETPISYCRSLLKSVLIRRLRRREKLAAYNTVDDVVALLRDAKRVLVLGGAGMSTSCGIPDFRSKDSGIYAQLQRDPRYAEQLADPHDMFDKHFFMHDPSLFFSFARSIFPSNFVPSPSHRFVKLLEERGLLLRNYTQNIDTLEQAAGIERVLHCHGSFARAACTTPECTYDVAGSVIKDDIFAQRVPYCPRCRDAEAQKREAARAKAAKGGKQAGWKDDDDDDDEQGDALPGLGVVKPCITFFGEKLSDDFGHCVVADREEVDLLLVIGTSLQVAPVSELVGHVPHSTPVVLINRTPVTHLAMDVQLLGDADTIVAYLCRRLGWSLPLPQPASDVVGQDSAAQQVAVEGKEVNGAGVEDNEPRRVGESNVWLFKGAEAEEVLDMFEQDSEEEGVDDAAQQSDDGDVHPRKRTASDAASDTEHIDANHKQSRIDTQHNHL